MRIAIIGAGIGGLTLAGLLSRRGFAVEVYEQAQRFARVGAGIQQSSNALKVLRALGLEDRLRATAFAPEVWNNREWDSGAVKHTLTLGARFEQRYGAPYLLLHRGDLHAALESALPAACLHLGHAVERVDGTTLHFTCGGTASADAVVAADGVHSPVRTQLFGAEAPRFNGRVAYRATFPAALMAEPLLDDCTKWWGPDRHIVMYYTKPDRSEVYFVTSVPEPNWRTESWSSKGDLTELRAAFAGFHPRVRAVLDACPEVHKWALVERDPLPRWHQGRVALLGDACHPMVPYMAQGATSAIEDAAVLARCLEAESDPERAFARYTATRHARASEIQLTSHRNEWMSTRTDPDWVYGYDALATPLAEAA